jgi:inorganic phosphate transporter, PiT family
MCSSNARKLVLKEQIEYTLKIRLLIIFSQILSNILLQIGLTALLAFYVAWNLGANDVANSMGTSVGSKAITLRQALLIAGVLEFTGAVIFSDKVSTTLATKIANPELFAQTPQLFLLGMVAVLIACGLWLQIATTLALPVASSHAIVGAIAGFSWVAVGKEAIDWHSIGNITLAWLITPLISGSIAATFYFLLKRFIFDRQNILFQLQEWIPWLSSILLGIFGVIVLPPIFNRPWFASFALPPHTLSVVVGSIAAIGLTIVSWNRLQRLQQENKDRQYFDSQIAEKLLGRFQIVSACFVAFAHGSNDVGNAIAPLAAIDYVLRDRSVPIDSLVIPYWILLLGGLGIVAGLSFQGERVIATIGEGIIPLQPSIGFCAEMAAATTILVASRFGLPISTSHSLVGGVLGIAILQQRQNLRFQTVKSVILAWAITLPISAILGALSYKILTLFTIILQ